MADEAREAQPAVAAFTAGGLGSVVAAGYCQLTHSIVTSLHGDNAREGREVTRIWHDVTGQIAPMGAGTMPSTWPRRAKGGSLDDGAMPGYIAKITTRYAG